MVSFDMPGVKKDDINIEVQGNQLMVSGERFRETKRSDEDMALRHERTYGKFERVFMLPKSIESDKIEAQFENGVLNVAVPKTEVAKGKKIEIQSGDAGFFTKILGSKKETSKKVKEVATS
jgi:HSP20 family protein